MKKVLVSLFLIPSSVLSVDIVFFNNTCQDTQAIIHPECTTCPVLETTYTVKVTKQSSSSFKIQQPISEVQILFDQDNGYINGRTFITPIDATQDKVILSIDRSSSNKQISLNKLTENALEAYMNPQNKKMCSRKPKTSPQS